MKYDIKAAFSRFATLSTLLVGSCASPTQPSSIPPWRPLAASFMIGADAVTIQGDPRFAGAISSLVFRGQEYVNNADHGRLMQGAIAYNGRYECLNPTQAGGSRDRLNLAQRSSSQRLTASASSQGFSVSTRMAYWLRPGMFCDIPGLGRQPVDNHARTSADVYSQTHQFGFNGLANTVGIDISYAVAGAYQSAVVEALTIYAPPDFNVFYSLNPSDGTITIEPTTTPDETPSPMILATSDGKHAIGFVSRQTGATYARFRFPDTNKISLVYRDMDGITGLNHYKAAWVIGTRDEVAASMKILLGL